MNPPPVRCEMDDLEVEIAVRVRTAANDRPGRDDADRIDLLEDELRRFPERRRVRLEEAWPGTLRYPVGSHVNRV